MNQLSIHNPATGPLIERIAADDAASVAAKAAPPAPPSRPGAPAHERARWRIVRFRAAVVAELDGLAAILTRRRSASPSAGLRNELNGLLAAHRLLPGAGRSRDARRTCVRRRRHARADQHMPLGVVANISAWNYPWFVGCNVIVPALLTGNVVLYKPANTPR